MYHYKDIVLAITITTIMLIIAQINLLKTDLRRVPTQIT